MFLIQYLTTVLEKIFFSSVVMVLAFRPGVPGSNRVQTLYFCHAFIHLFLCYGLCSLKYRKVWRTRLKTFLRMAGGPRTLILLILFQRVRIKRIQLTIRCSASEAPRSIARCTRSGRK